MPEAANAQRASSGRLCVRQSRAAWRAGTGLRVRRVVDAESGIGRRSVVVYGRFSQLRFLPLRAWPLELARVRQQRVIAGRGVGQGALRCSNTQRCWATNQTQARAGLGRGRGRGRLNRRAATTLFSSFDGSASPAVDFAARDSQGDADERCLGQRVLALRSSQRCNYLTKSVAGVVGPKLNLLEPRRHLGSGMR